MDTVMLASETAENNPVIAILPLLFVGALVWWGIKGIVNAHRENREVEANARLVKRFVRGELENEADLKRAQLLAESKGYSSTYEHEKARVESAGGTVSAASRDFDAAEPERRKREAEREAERERVDARAAELEEEFAGRNGRNPNVDEQVYLFHEAYEELVEPSDPLGYCTICGRGINPRAPRATVTDDKQYTHTKCDREQRIAAKEVVEAPEVVPNSILAVDAAELEADRVAMRKRVDALEQREELERAIWAAVDDGSFDEPEPEEEPESRPVSLAAGKKPLSLADRLRGRPESALERDARVRTAKLEEKWGSYLGIMLRTFEGPEQVINHMPTGAAFSDTCLVCGCDSRPDTIVTYKTFTRGYYKCELQHPSGELPAWWTDWESSEVVDRQVIFTPDLLGGGTSWSTVQLGKKWGDEVSDLVEWLRPAEEEEEEAQ